MWRCVSRLDYGKKYCHSSPTLDEVPLQQAIIAALNTVLPDLDGRIRQITEALEAEVIPFPGSGMSLGDIDRRLTELEAQFQRLLEKAADDPIAYGDQFKEILDEQTALKELRATILAENKNTPKRIGASGMPRGCWKTPCPTSRNGTRVPSGSWWRR